MLRDEAIEYLRTKVPENEPVFVLRAQDKKATEVVQRWVYLAAEALGWNHPKVTSAEKVVEAFAAWPTKKHPD